MVDGERRDKVFKEGLLYKQGEISNSNRPSENEGRLVDAAKQDRCATRGPGGTWRKMSEQETGCRVPVRGRYAC